MFVQVVCLLWLTIDQVVARTVISLSIDRKSHNKRMR